MRGWYGLEIGPFLLVLVASAPTAAAGISPHQITRKGCRFIAATFPVEPYPECP